MIHKYTFIDYINSILMIIYGFPLYLKTKLTQNDKGDLK
ncbi:hypothetical protein [Nitrososphaeria virus YSH_922147]|uniref:Uncharacterized protein n=1 Tax=Nitrososphaeria virus YSH_922147 TaxID=3071323 RepID=A0A976UAP1_9CAUD|nr:hypothetical protein QKV94_gp06 [Yangshan Harbor Nitrososphaeria virus]UVF62415.1 hypothetical protein [Nitrososphaeria virus YSH_922147]